MERRRNNHYFFINLKNIRKTLVRKLFKKRKWIKDYHLLSINIKRVKNIEELLLKTVKFYVNIFRNYLILERSKSFSF